MNRHNRTKSINSRSLFFPENIEINVINSWMRCTGVTCACRGEVYEKKTKKKKKKKEQ
jgi:hypothetical protein